MDAHKPNTEVLFMWHIIIQTSAGRVYRVHQEDKPDTSSLEYWEAYYTDKDDYKHQAIVFNIYYTEE